MSSEVFSNKLETNKQKSYWFIFSRVENSANQSSFSFGSVAWLTLYNNAISLKAISMQTGSPLLGLYTFYCFDKISPTIETKSQGKRFKVVNFLLWGISMQLNNYGWKNNIVIFFHRILFHLI